MDHPGSETEHGTGDEDIAWDAVAFQPLAAKPANFVVALGDSYASGEGATSDGCEDYYRETDNNGDNVSATPVTARKYAWPSAFKLKDTLTESVGSRADRWDAALDFAFLSCSGAQSENLLPDITAGTPKPTNAFGETAGAIPQRVPTRRRLLLGEHRPGGLQHRRQRRAVSGRSSPSASESRGNCHQDDFKGEGPLNVYLPNLIKTKVRSSIETSISQIAAKAPNAKIMLQGYPKLFSYDGWCIQGISTEEAAFLNSMGNLLTEPMQGHWQRKNRKASRSSSTILVRPF